MRRQQSLRYGILIIFGIALGLIVASGLNFTQPSQSAPPFQPPVTNVSLGSQESIPEALLQLQNTSDAFIYIAERVVPTVVSIQSTRIFSSDELGRMHDNDALRDLFRFKNPREFKQEGSGSGIIVTRDGYILTNVHVVDKSEKLIVTLSDDREFDAQVVGLDPLTEVAVVKIDGKDLPAARLGDSDKCRVGEWVLAIGNPLELRSTVTAGIISAKGRQIDILRDQFSVESFIQTDAAINPGNSGGALVNLKGEVIGVNTAIATETGYNAGFGFAIPITLARKIMTDLIYKGHVERAYLGIAMLNMDEQKARALAMPRPQGVFIDRVLANSPADKAGVRPKDVILKIGGDEVNRSNQVQAIIARRNPDDLIDLEIFRDGRSMNLKVKLESRQTSTTRFTSNERIQEFKYLGIGFEDVTSTIAKRLDYRGQAGVHVTDVERLSPAAEAGILPGDVIVEIDDRHIGGKRDFREAVSDLGKGSVAIFKIIRRNQEMHAFVNVPDI